MTRKMEDLLFVAIMALTASFCFGGLLKDFSLFFNIIADIRFGLDFMWFFLLGVSVLSWKDYMDGFEPGTAILRVIYPMLITFITMKFSVIFAKIFEIFGFTFPS